jgi:hypothetical protein
MSSEPHDHPVHLVHPRWVWVGVATAVGGMVLAGVEMMVGTTAWTLVGAAVIVIGLAVGWRGGIMYDVHATKALHHEVPEVIRGDVHEGISPSDQQHGQPTRRHAEPPWNQRSLGVGNSASTIVPTPALAPLGVMGLLLLACWLLVGRWIVSYPKTVHGYTNGEHDLAFAIMVALCAIWMRQIGPNRVMTGLTSLWGVLLVVTATVLPHDASGVEWDEATVGVLVLLCAGLTLSVKPPAQGPTSYSSR